MIMVAESLPDCKGFLKPASHALSDASTKMIARCMVAFLLRSGRMSCLQAAGALQCDPRHRAQVSRFFARPRWQGVDINSLLRQDLLDRETEKVSGTNSDEDRRHAVPARNPQTMVPALSPGRMHLTQVAPRPWLTVFAARGTISIA